MFHLFVAEVDKKKNDVRDVKYGENPSYGGVVGVCSTPNCFSWSIPSFGSLFPGWGIPGGGGGGGYGGRPGGGSYELIWLLIVIVNCLIMKSCYKIIKPLLQ